MGPLGIPELIIGGFVVGPILIAIAYAAILLTIRARKLGYGSTRDYLRAVPRSDAERRDAADIAMQGLVICLLGLIFKPVVLAGLIPLFYGGRKLAYATLGLGLVDDSDRPRA